MLYRPSDGIQDSEVYRELLRISQVFAVLDTGNIRVLHVAPEKPSDGDTAICDGGDWNPLGDGIKRPVWFNASLALWVAF